MDEPITLGLDAKAVEAALLKLDGLFTRFEKAVDRTAEAIGNLQKSLDRLGGGSVKRATSEAIKRQKDLHAEIEATTRASRRAAKMVESERRARSRALLEQLKAAKTLRAVRAAAAKSESNISPSALRVLAARSKIDLTTQIARERAPGGRLEGVSAGAVAEIKKLALRLGSLSEAIDKTTKEVRGNKAQGTRNVAVSASRDTLLDARVAQLQAPGGPLENVRSTVISRLKKLAIRTGSLSSAMQILEKSIEKDTAAFNDLKSQREVEKESRRLAVSLQRARQRLEVENLLSSDARTRGASAKTRNLIRDTIVASETAAGGEGNRRRFLEEALATEHIRRAVDADRGRSDGRIRNRQAVGALARRRDIDALTRFDRAIVNSTERISGFVSSLRYAFGVVLAGYAVQSSVKFAGEFEQSIAQIETLMDNSKVSIQRYKEQLLELSLVSSKDLLDVTKTLYQTISGGIPAVEGAAGAFAVTEAAVRAAEVGLSTSEEAANGMISVMNAYKGTALTAVDASDKLLLTVFRGRTLFPELANSIGRVASTAATFGVSLDELLAGLAALTRVGLSTENAVVALNRVILSLARPAVESQKAFEAIGFEATAAALKQRGLAGSIRELNRAAGGNADVLKVLFKNVRALRGIIPLTTNAYEDFESILAELGDSAGTTDRAMKKVEDNFLRQALILRSRFQKVLVEITSDSLPALIEMMKSLGNFLEYNSGEFKQFAETFIRAFVYVVRFLTENAGALFDLATALVAVFAVSKIGAIANGFLGITTVFQQFGGAIAAATAASGSFFAVMKAGIASIGIGTFAGLAATAFIGGLHVGETFLNGLRKAISEKSESIWFVLLGGAIAGGAIAGPLGAIVGLIASSLAVAFAALVGETEEQVKESLARVSAESRKASERLRERTAKPRRREAGTRDEFFEILDPAQLDANLAEVVSGDKVLSPEFFRRNKAPEIALTTRFSDEGAATSSLSLADGVLGTEDIGTIQEILQREVDRITEEKRLRFGVDVEINPVQVLDEAQASLETAFARQDELAARSIENERKQIQSLEAEAEQLFDRLRKQGELRAGFLLSKDAGFFGARSDVLESRLRDAGLQDFAEVAGVITDRQKFSGAIRDSDALRDLLSALPADTSKAESEGVFGIRGVFRADEEIAQYNNLRRLLEGLKSRKEALAKITVLGDKEREEVAAARTDYLIKRQVEALQAASRKVVESLREEKRVRDELAEIDKKMAEFDISNIQSQIGDATESLSTARFRNLEIEKMRGDELRRTLGLTQQETDVLGLQLDLIERQSEAKLKSAQDALDATRAEFRIEEAQSRGTTMVPGLVAQVKRIEALSRGEDADLLSNLDAAQFARSQLEAIFRGDIVDDLDTEGVDELNKALVEVSTNLRMAAESAEAPKFGEVTSGARRTAEELRDVARVLDGLVESRQGFLEKFRAKLLGAVDIFNEAREQIAAETQDQIASTVTGPANEANRTSRIEQINRRILRLRHEATESARELTRELEKQADALRRQHDFLLAASRLAVERFQFESERLQIRGQDTRTSSRDLALIEADRLREELALRQRELRLKDKAARDARSAEIDRLQEQVQAAQNAPGGPDLDSEIKLLELAKERIRLEGADRSVPTNRATAERLRTIRAEEALLRGKIAKARAGDTGAIQELRDKIESQTQTPIELNLDQKKLLLELDQLAAEIKDRIGSIEVEVVPTLDFSGLADEEQLALSLADAFGISKAKRSPFARVRDELAQAEAVARRIEEDNPDVAKKARKELSETIRKEAIAQLRSENFDVSDAADPSKFSPDLKKRYDQIQEEQLGSRSSREILARMLERDDRATEAEVRALRAISGRENELRDLTEVLQKAGENQASALVALSRGEISKQSLGALGAEVSPEAAAAANLIIELPTILDSLASFFRSGISDWLEALFASLGEFLMAFFDGLPDQLLVILTELLPRLFEGIAKNADKFVVALITAIPKLIEAATKLVIDGIPRIVKALVVTLPPALVRGVVEAFKNIDIPIPGLPDWAKGAAKGAAAGLGIGFLAGVPAIGAGIGAIAGLGLFHQGGPIRGGSSPLAAATLALAGAPRFAEGGVVSRPGTFTKARLANIMAGDDVPSVLQAGEGVLSRLGMQAVGGEAGLKQLNRGGDGGAPVVNMQFSGGLRHIMPMIVSSVAVSAASGSGEVRRSVVRSGRQPLMASYVKR